MDLIEALRNLGVEESLIKRIWRNFSGCPVYISKYKEIDLDERNAAIYSDFNGRNVKELCVKYELGFQQIYKIIKHQRGLKNDN